MDRRGFIKAGSSLLGGAMLGGLTAPGVGLAQGAAPPLPPPGADGWVALFNGRDLSGWYTMLATSGKGVAEKRKMVTVEQEMLHIMGNEVTDELFEAGYIATNQEFGDVHIRLECRFGMKRFFPRTLSKRDNGLLYGLVGEDHVWPTMVEYQIEEGDTGDIYLVGGVRGVQPPHAQGLTGVGANPTTGWPKEGTPQARALIRTPRPGAPPPPEPNYVSNRLLKDGDFENLDGWNIVEVIWKGDRAIHILNGRTVAEITNLQYPDPKNAGKFLPLTRGKIALEIEYAETWFRRVEVRSLA